MKKTIQIIATIIFLLLIFLAYQYGKYNAKLPNYETTYSINNRYDKVFGSPNTNIEQLLRDYIIYNDIDNDTIKMEEIIKTKDFKKILE